MARLKGLLKFKGTMGDITFYKTQDGYVAREKGGIDKKRMATDPAFQRTRENGSEFGRAGKATKLLRMALRPLLVNAADDRLTSRLVKEMVKVIQADQVSERGLRNVIDGEAELLTGFEFNIYGKFDSSFYPQYEASIDRLSGNHTFEVQPFVPQNMIAAPVGTTHYKLVTAGLEVDFEANTYTLVPSATEVLPWDNAETALISQTNTVIVNSTKPLFLVVGVEYYQEINGAFYPLKNGSYNSLKILKVDSGV